MSIKEILSNHQGTIIDVRNPGEVAMGAIPGALNIPVQEIPGRIGEISKLAEPLVIYCQSGGRSGMALMMLHSAGVKMEMYNGGGYADMLQLMN